MSEEGNLRWESTNLLMARTEMPSWSNRQATSATRARMLLRSAMRVPLSAYFMLVLSSAVQTTDGLGIPCSICCAAAAAAFSCLAGGHPLQAGWSDMATVTHMSKPEHLP